MTALVPYTLDQMTRARSAALAGLSPQSCRVYTRHLNEFLADSRPLSRESVVSYLDSRKLKPSSHNQALSAIKRLALEAAENGWLDWHTARAIDGIKGRKLLGTRAGNWLTRDDSSALLALPDTGTLTGLRDRAVLCLLLGCGLRRAELSTLRYSQLQYRNNGLHIIDLVGKGDRLRTVKVPQFVSEALHAWILAAALSDGYLIRSFRPSGETSDRPLCVSSIRSIVLDYCARISVSATPHDLRRTFAKLARKAGAPLDVVQRSLGHSSVQTTERYTNSGEDANAGDWIGL